VAAIEQTNALPDIMVKYILIANQQCLSDDYIQGVVYDYRNQMFPGGIEEVHSYISDTVSPRQQLEANISYYASQRKTYLDLIKKYYLADNAGNSLNNLTDLLSNETDIESQYELVFAQLSKQDYEGAANTLENIGDLVKYRNKAEEIERYNKMSSIIPILVRVETDNSWDYVPQTDKDSLIVLSETNRGLPGSIARAARLQFEEEFVYDEPIYTYEPETLRMAKPIRKTTTKPADENYLKIKPNPADEYIVVSYSINGIVNEPKLFITDAMGRTLLVKNLSKTTDEQLLIIKDYAKGNYICTITNNGKPIKSGKFIKN
ncbi:MAG: T9SS type A sorting domain-containing protein, partial [Bacteroidota bacterium]